MKAIIHLANICLLLIQIFSIQVEGFNLISPSFRLPIQILQDVSPIEGLVTTEAGGSATFEIVLDSAPTADVTIPLSSSNEDEGTIAVASVTFTTADWNTAQEITVTGVDDDLADGDVVYYIETGLSVSIDPAFNGLDFTDVEVTNVDNDTAGFIVTPIDQITTEGGETGSFSIRLTSEPTGTVTIGLSSSDTTEGTVSPASVSFDNTDWNDPQTVTVTGVDDFIDDEDIPYSIITGTPTSTDNNYNNIDPDDVNMTNLDDDIAGITISPNSELTTNEGGGQANFSIFLDSEPTGTVTIGLSSSDTTEGTVSPTTVSFDNTDWNDPQTVTVTGVDDFIADGNITYTIITGAATSNDGNYDNLNPVDVSVENNDDDIPGITVSPLTLSVSESGTQANFSVVLDSMPTGSVTIAITSLDTGEALVSDTEIVLDETNWNVLQTVTVTGVDEDIDDDNQDVTIQTSPAVSSDTNYDNLNAADVSVTVQDDDTAGITITPTSDLETTESGGIDTFSVVLDSRPTASVTFNFSSSDTGEGTVTPSTTFQPNDWDNPVEITVTGVNDPQDDGNQNYTITASTTSVDPLYNGITPVIISVINIDDDATPIAVDDIYTTLEETTLNRAAELGVLNNDSDADGDELEAVLVDSVDNGTLTLNPDGSFSYTPEKNFAGSDQFTYQAFDGALYSNTASVTINVNNENDPPTAVADSYTIDEDTTLSVDAIGVLQNDTDPDGDTLQAYLVEGPAHGVLDLRSNGSFTFTPNDNYFGADSFSYYASDGAFETETVLVTITIEAVNDRPIAAADSYGSNATNSEPLVIAAPGVLANDSDVDEGTTLTAQLVSPPFSGSVILNEDGSFTYIPKTGFEGTDSFSYYANDGEELSMETIVEIYIDTTAPPVPIWLSPELNMPSSDPIYYNGTAEEVILEVGFENDIQDVEKVEFWYWDHIDLVYRLIDVISTPPYSTTIKLTDYPITEFPFTVNQFFANAIDYANNESGYPKNPLWINRDYYNNYLPIIFK